MSGAIESALIPIRYYVPQDVYYYTIDNRPLTDLMANIQTVAAGVDANTVLIQQAIDDALAYAIIMGF